MKWLRNLWRRWNPPASYPCLLTRQQAIDWLVALPPDAQVRLDDKGLSLAGILKAKAGDAK